MAALAEAFADADCRSAARDYQRRRGDRS